MTTTSTMTTMTCWDDIRSEWSKAQQMGHQAVMQAAKIGRMLIDMKGDTPIREFVQRAEQEVQGLKQTSIQNLMNIAQHHALIEAEKPSSQRQALALIKKAKHAPTPQRNPVAIKQLRLEGRQSRARDAARLAELQQGVRRQNSEKALPVEQDPVEALHMTLDDSDHLVVGVFTEWEFELICDCLEPSSEVAPDRRAEAFRLFAGRHDLLVRPSANSESVSVESPATDGAGETTERRAA